MFRVFAAMLVALLATAPAQAQIMIPMYSVPKLPKVEKGSCAGIQSGFQFFQVQCIHDLHFLSVGIDGGTPT